jgi:hypothetical protein
MTETPAVDADQTKALWEAIDDLRRFRVRMLLALPAVTLVAGVSYGEARYAIAQNTKSDIECADEVKKLKKEEIEHETIMTKIATHQSRQDEGINWIGEALERLAEKDKVKLPARPIITDGD